MIHSVFAMLPVLDVMELIRYGFVGTVCGALYYSLFWYVHEVRNVHYQIANVLGIVPALLLNFLLHKLWTFGGTGLQTVLPEFIQFGAKKSGFYLLNASCLYILVEIVGMRSRYATLVLIPGLGIPGYLVVKWIFAH